MPMQDAYALLDSGGGRKLEQFGPVRLDRPCAQAVWTPRLPAAEWQAATAVFDREQGNCWSDRAALPKEWTVRIDGLRMKLAGTDFGHLGVFPEQRPLWSWIGDSLAAAARRGAPRAAVLNLFAYSGGSTLAAAAAGAEVCHVDASAGMVEWARENARLNGLDAAPVRWIVDDARKFLARELRRGRRYDAVILDPPSFGRGSKGEVFKIETHLPEMLDTCVRLLSDRPLFFLLSAHTPGFSPLVLDNLLRTSLPLRNASVECGEMVLAGAPGVLPVPNGCYARWAPSKI